MTGSEAGLFEETLKADNGVRIARINPGRQHRQRLCSGGLRHDRQLKNGKQSRGIRQLQLLGKIGLMHILAGIMAIRRQRLLIAHGLVATGRHLCTQGKRRVSSRQRHTRDGLRLTDREDQQNEAHAQCNGLALDAIHGFARYRKVRVMMLESIPKYRVKYATQEAAR